MLNLTSAQLRKAADLQDKIEKLQSELVALVGAGPAPATVQTVKPAKPVKKGGMSAAGRAKVAAAQKARWAKINGAKPGAKAVVKTAVKAVVAAKPAKKKYTMSAAAKAKISAAAKARWAKVRAEKK